VGVIPEANPATAVPAKPAHHLVFDHASRPDVAAHGPAAINRAGGAVGWSADLSPLPNDPKVARPRLKPIHRRGDIARGRLGRPTLADAPDLAAALQVLKAGKHLVAVETRRPSGHRRRERRRQLAKSRS